jgi:hypothetical protein
MQKQGKQAELQLAEFDAVPCTKVSEIHVLRVETTSSSLSVGALYRRSLGFFCRLECSRRGGVYCTRASVPVQTISRINVAFASTERKLKESIHNAPPSPYPATAPCAQDEMPRQGPKTPIQILHPAARTENCLSECVCPLTGLVREGNTRERCNSEISAVAEPLPTGNG